MKRFLSWLALLLATPLWAGVPLAPPPAPEKAISAYLDELGKVESARTPVSLEPLFDATDVLQSALMELRDERAWLETLPEPAFAALKGSLRGIVLSRGVDVYAQPDPAYFLALAQAHGQPQDAAFFRHYKAYWDEELVPVYLYLGQRQRPCVRYGEGRLAPVYEAWRGYTQAYPGSYRAFARQAVSDVEDAVEQGMCSCGEARSVRNEQAAFLQRFPGTRAPERIRARMKELESYPADVPVMCP